VEKLQKERAALDEEHDELSSVPDQCAAIEHSCKESSNAIESYRKFYAETKEYLARKRSDLAQSKAGTAERKDRIGRLNEEVRETVESCRAKGIDPESAAQANLDSRSKELQYQVRLEILDLRGNSSYKIRTFQIDHKRSLAHDIANRITALEIELSREQMSVSKVVSELQFRLSQLGLEPDHPVLTVAQSASPQDAFGPVQTLLGELMAEVRELRLNCDNAAAAVEKTELKIKTSAKAKGEAEVGTKKYQSVFKVLEASIEEQGRDSPIFLQFFYLFSIFFLNLF
jgi:chromosome segregation ATPase